MRKEEKNIFYIGIAEGKSAGKRDLLREGLPIRTLGRKFSYLYWERKNVTVSLQVDYALLPQKEKKLWWEREWRPEIVEKLLEKTAENAARQCNFPEQAITPLLGRDRSELPIELMAVCLYRYKPFDRVCLSLPEEGERFVDQALWLLRPYLPRIRKAVICGGANENGELIRDELYEEFGIVLTDVPKPEPGMVWLDLRDGVEPERMDEEAGPRADRGLDIMDKGASFKQKCVNVSQAWKFLDTAVKNGYNTEVN